jgi:hypothetical protein
MTYLPFFDVPGRNFLTLADSTVADAGGTGMSLDGGAGVDSGAGTLGGVTTGSRTADSRFRPANFALRVTKSVPA